MKTIVIGSGISGLSCASFLAKKGYDVTIFEKNEQIGGRAREFKADGFTFDMGPSWYWMPDVFEDFYQKFGHTTSDFYNLKRLSPSYRIFWGEGEKDDIPADYDELKALFEGYESGAGDALDQFMTDGQKKYEKGVGEMVYKPSTSIQEFIKLEYLQPIFIKSLFNSFEKHAKKYFKHPKLLQLMEFPILFLGATAKNTPSLYSLMNYADMKLGTWYPMGGMHKIIEAFSSIALENNVKIHTNSEVEKIEVDSQSKKAKGVVVNNKMYEADVVIGGADYHHVDKQLLQKNESNYSHKYWDNRKLAPSALIYYIGVDKKISGLKHHNLFFDEDFGQHSKEIYTDKKWPESPLFYVCCPSKTDPEVAPTDKENLFILIPVAVDLEDSEEIRKHYFEYTIQKLEAYTGESIRDHVVYKKQYAQKEFKEDYHSFKGNAYGLANTLDQTAYFKPQILNKNISNLFYTGQLTVPGPGVPPSIISGEVVANQIIKKYDATF